MTDDRRKGNQRPFPGDGVEVTAAQAAGSDPDQHFAGLRRCQVDLGDLKGRVDAGEHGSPDLHSMTVFPPAPCTQ
jgi:hypothetical protein